MPRTALILGLTILLVVCVLFSRSSIPAQPVPALPASATISLNVTKAPLRAVLAEVKRQTKVTVDDQSGQGEKPISLTLKNAGFWEALDRIAALVEARVWLAGDGAPILVKRQASDRTPPTSIDGDFRLVIKRISATRDLDSDQASCTLGLELSWVATRHLMFVDTLPQQIRVVASGGKSLPVQDEGSSLASVEGRKSLTFDLQLPGVSRSMAKLALLQGRLVAVGPNKMLLFRFDADLNTLAKAVPGGAQRQIVQDKVTCQIEKVVFDRGRWSVRVGLTYPEGGKELESFQAASLVVHNELKLVSKDGKTERSSSTYAIESASARRASVTYHFALPRGVVSRPADWKVQYRAPALVIEYPIPFTFKDIPLP